MLALVVDDETLIRMDAAELVGAAGYETVEAANGDQALDILGSTRIDLLFTDVQMPGVGGLALAEAVLRRWPAARVVVASGSLVEPWIMPRHAVFIPKPFSPWTVFDAIARAGRMRHSAS